LVPDPNLPPVDPNAPVAGALPVIGTPREIADQARITELNAWFDSVSSPQDASREDRIKASVELATLTAPEGASEEAIKFAAALFLRESGFANDDYRNWSSNFREGNNGFNMKEVGTEGTRNIADRETVNGQDVMLRSDFGTYHTVADNFQSFWGWMAEKPNYSGFTDIQDPMQGLEVMAQSGWATDMGQLEKIRYAQRTGDHSVFTQNDKDSLLYEMAWTSGVFRSQSWNIDGHYQAVAPEIQAARDAAAQQLAAEQASATEAPPIEGEGDISPPQG
jgi:hypothetical protein